MTRLLIFIWQKCHGVGNFDRVLYLAVKSTWFKIYFPQICRLIHFLSILSYEIWPKTKLSSLNLTAGYFKIFVGNAAFLWQGGTIRIKYWLGWIYSTIEIKIPWGLIVLEDRCLHIHLEQLHVGEWCHRFETDFCLRCFPWWIHKWTSDRSGLPSEAVSYHLTCLEGSSEAASFRDQCQVGP